MMSMNIERILVLLIKNLSSLMEQSKKIYNITLKVYNRKTLKKLLKRLMLFILLNLTNLIIRTARKQQLWAQKFLDLAFKDLLDLKVVKSQVDKNKEQQQLEQLLKTQIYFFQMKQPVPWILKMSLLCKKLQTLS